MSDQQETLLTSVVPRSLEAKNKILGFELLDVILLLLNLSIQNLVFGATALKLPMVVGTTALFAGLLFFFKRGKPDQFLNHYLEYLRLPAVQPANSTDSDYRPFRKGDANGRS
jgi:hypothetical protein